jgi:hypothetical protein
VRKSLRTFVVVQAYIIMLLLDYVSEKNDYESEVYVPIQILMMCFRTHFLCEIGNSRIKCSTRQQTITRNLCSHAMSLSVGTLVDA